VGIAPTLCLKERVTMSNSQDLNIPISDSRYGIFKEIFLIRVPLIHTRTTEDIQYFGVPTSGMREYDDPYEKITVMWTIDKMVECYHSGGQIYIPSEETVLEIYNRITNHLNVWMSEIRHTRNLSIAPIEDLKKLDDFANSIYEHAKYHITEEFFSELQAVMPDSMKKLNGISKIFSTPVSTKPQEYKGSIRFVSDKSSAPTQPEPEPERVFPKRNNFTSFVTEEKSQGQRPYGFHDDASSNVQDKTSRGKFLGGQKLSYSSLVKRGQ